MRLYFPVLRCSTFAFCVCFDFVILCVRLFVSVFMYGRRGVGS